MSMQGLQKITSKVAISSQALQFLCLSFISGIVELGSITFSFRQNLKPIELIGVGLIYQIGNLVPVPVTLNWLTSLIFVISSLILLLYTYLSGFNYWIFLLAVVLFAGCLQLARSITKGEVSTFTKRLARVAGFLCAPTTGTLGLVVCCLVVLLTLFWGRDKIGESKLHFPKLSFLNGIMIAHQIHYFCYVYTILFWIMTLLHEHYLLIGSVFTLGWLSYISTPFFLRGNSYIQYSVIGHLWLTVILTLLAFVKSPILTIILWILTGFGGGTVFCISNLLKESVTSTKNHSIDFSENIGHVLGVVTSLALFAWTNSVSVTILFAALFAFATAILLLVYSYRLQQLTSAD